MSWRLGIAVPVLAGALGCATARPETAPEATGAAAIPAASLATVAGEYTLVNINGHTLPYPSADGSDAARSTSWPVLGGTLSLRANGTFHMATTYNTGASDAEKNSYQFTGTCYSSGPEFTMVWDGGGQTAFAVRGDTVVLKNEGRAFSYVRH